MTLEYTNRKGDVYIPQAGKTKTGKPRYWCGQKLTGEPLDAIPAGYEFREDPASSIVTLRKVRPTEISPLEIEILSDGIRKYAGLEYFIVDVEGDSLVVYISDRGADVADELREMFGGRLWAMSSRMQESKDRIMRRSNYSKMMRFRLVDPAKRLFFAQRWCFRGSVNDWIGLGSRTRAPLPDLVRAYVQDLGKDSFYDLM
ncbi:MAG: hypothetical protein WCJ35_08715 [Planctomycetota bacterium]